MGPLGRRRRPLRIVRMAGGRTTCHQPPAHTHRGAAHDRSHRDHQALRRHPGRRRSVLRRQARADHRVSRPQRIGKVHHHAHDHGARHARRRAGQGQRHRLPATSPGRSAKSAPSWRPRPSIPGRSARNHLWHWPRPTTSRARGSTRSSTWSGLTSVAHKRAGTFSLGMGQRLGHRRRPPRRSQRPALRRAHQRARSRGHPMGSQPAEGTGPGGAHGLRLQSPHERDGPDRRPPGGHRPGAPHRRDAGGRVHRPELPAVRAGPHPAGRPVQGWPCAASGATVVQEEDGALSVTGVSAEEIGDIAFDQRLTLARALAADGLTRRGLHGADPGQRRLPRRGRLCRRPRPRHPTTTGSRRQESEHPMTLITTTIPAPEAPHYRPAGGDAVRMDQVPQRPVDHLDARGHRGPHHRHRHHRPPRPRPAGGPMRGPSTA